MAYHFGVPGWVVWLTHILVGLLLAWIGYQINDGKEVNKNLGLVLLVIGSVVPLYHAHLWYLSYTSTASA